MIKPSLFRILSKDIVDFLVIALLVSLGIYGVYRISGAIKPVELSLYYPEQIAELFFVNPLLALWGLFLAWVVSLGYFIFCYRLLKNTLGGLAAGVFLVDVTTKKSITLYQAVLMGVGAFLGVFVFFIGPLYAWWLDSEHRGWSEKLAGVMWVT